MARTGGFYKVKTDGGEHIKIPVMTVPSETGIGVVDNWLIYAYVYDTEMVRISDTYDTDALFDWIHVDQLESALRKHDTDDPFNQAMAERYEDYEIRKYENFTPFLSEKKDDALFAEAAESLDDDKWYSSFDLRTNNFVEHDEWIYYSEFGRFVGGELYRIKTDGTQKTKIYDGWVRMFWIANKRLYVLPVGGEITGMNFDGSDESLRDTVLSYAESFVVEDDWIYMLLSGSIYKSNADSVPLMQLSFGDEVCIDFSVSGGWIYYLRQTFDEEWGMHLYRMRTDGTDKKKLTSQMCMSVDYDREWIYYIEKSGKSIYKMKMDGSENQKLTNCNSYKMSFFKVFGDWVYYENIGDDFGLYKVNTQSGESIKVLETRINADACMGGNWLINRSTDYSAIPSKTTYQMIRVGNSETTDDIIEQILKEMPEDIEIRKYE